MNISEAQIEKIVRRMFQPENRRFYDDSVKIAAGRIIFARWMKERGLWLDYMCYINSKALAEYVEKAWKKPQRIVDFLGETDYKYEVYILWYHFCDELEAKINHAYYKLIGIV